MQLAAVKQRVRRTTFTRGLALSALLSTLLGCASQNHVEKIVDEDSVVNYADVEGYEDRYTNIYDDFRDYPVTCEENCYPASEEITCEKEMENCLFT